MKKLLCRIFGHPHWKHYHKETDIIWCEGGCEKYEEVYKILPCERCSHPFNR